MIEEEARVINTTKRSILQSFIESQKLVLVLMTFVLTIVINKKVHRLLKHIFCIHHLVHFKKDLTKIQTLINSKSEVNIITLAYMSKLVLKI